MNHFAVRAVSNRSSDPDLGTMHQMPIPWYSGPTGQFMRLTISVVLLVTLLALTEDVASPQQPAESAPDWLDRV